MTLSPTWNVTYPPLSMVSRLGVRAKSSPFSIAERSVGGNQKPCENGHFSLVLPPGAAATDTRRGRRHRLRRRHFEPSNRFGGKDLRPNAQAWPTQVSRAGRRYDRPMSPLVPAAVLLLVLIAPP